MKLEYEINNRNEDYINIQNVRIYYEKYHHPQPVATLVFIHGFLSSSYSFRKIFPPLLEKFSIISIDLPGFGKSEKSLSFYYSYQNFGKLIVEFINHLDLKKVILIGHSMGGQIALYTARQAPHMVEKLILIASSSYYRRARRSAILFSYFPTFHWFAEKWYKRQDIKKYFIDTLIDKELLNQEMLDNYAQPFYEKNFMKGLIRLMRHREGDLSPKDLTEINIPAILIWGKEDKSVPLSVGERLYSDLPKSKLVVVDQAGHLICEERPMEIVQEIMAATRQLQ